MMPSSFLPCGFRCHRWPPLTRPNRALSDHSNAWIAPGDCLMHWAQAGCAVSSMLCIALRGLHGCACNNAVLHTFFQTQSSIVVEKGQEGVGGEGSETPPCLERTPPPLTVCSQARMALCRRTYLLVQACPGQESAAPRQTCASRSKHPPLQAFETPGSRVSMSGDSSGQHYCPEGRI